MIVLSTIALTLFDRRFDRDFPRRWREGIAESFHQVMSIATTGKASRKNLFGWVGRIWSALWLVCGVAVVAYITSSVTSVMTAVSIEQQINSLADLTDKTTGVIADSSAEDYLTELGIATRPYKDLDAAVAAMKNGRVDAIVGDAPVLEYHAYHNPHDEMTVVGALFHPDKYGFAFPHDSELLREATLKILELQESGGLEELRLKYFGSAP
ncbi:transporter substrate-binding domain-containing protein [Nitratireductor sp. GISD-1A_MAKvit]|uniref:transporter substrate-binding domain-containing protein n=1 Tax=Nitratireductor sp. GISD-1A_MAKvit TaxID=3234198 RepID=UPI003466E3EB